MSATIDIKVKTAYILMQSEPDNSQYVFSYTITIRNIGQKAAKLMTRHWIITDAHGQTQEVKGEGVVGEQPHLQPGESFQYTSGAVLTTPIGSMHGSYQMITDEGDYLHVEIPPFSLAVPNMLH